MPDVNLREEFAAPPSNVWAIVSDLSRYPDWNLLHTRWVEPPPTVVETGATMVEVVTVKGMPDTITFTATEVDEPRLIRLTGQGTMGSTVVLELAIEPLGDSGSTVELNLSVTSSLLFGPVGRLIERAFRTKLVESIERLESLAVAGV
jgi:uncharacterized protein YndB with AHSA1/START domain